MLIVFGLIGALSAMISMANKKYGKIKSKKVNFVHITIMLLTILILGPSLNIILQLILNFKETFQTIYVQIGFLTPLLNIVLWIIITIITIIIITSILLIAGERSEKARKTLVAMIPIIFVLELVRVLSSVFSDMPGLYIGFAFLLMIILYLP